MHLLGLVVRNPKCEKVKEIELKQGEELSFTEKIEILVNFIISREICRLGINKSVKIVDCLNLLAFYRLLFYH